MNQTLKVMVTGANGQLGREIQKRAAGSSNQFFFNDIKELDLTDSIAVEHKVDELKPDVIVNCAAFTAVDLAETEQESAMKINVEAVRNIAGIASKRGIKVIHISSDYVFDGCSYQPYNEIHRPNPISFYGYTKLLGETELIESNCDGIIIRTSWLYSKEGKNFFKTIEKIAREQSEISIVFDQIGTPTYAGDLAEAILYILPQLNTVFGMDVYNFSNEGVCSWYDFACAIVNELKLNTVIYPIHTEEFPTPAQRPYYSVLDKSKIKNDFGIQINHWQKSLHLMMTSKK